jgi:hypothetical protein
MITLGWTPVTGLGYVFLVDSTRVSNTWNPSTGSVRFSVQSGSHTYVVDSVAVGVSGAVVSPPVSTTTVTTTVPASFNVLVSPSGSDSVCSRGGSPCQTFQRAYALANLGDSVGVMAGTFPPQTLTQVSGKTGPGVSPHVTFSPVPGAAVLLSSVQLGSSCCAGDGAEHLTFSGFVSQLDTQGPCGWYLGNGANDVTIQNVTACDVGLNGATNVTVAGSNLGNCNISLGTCQYNLIDSSPAGNNITYTGNTIHDYSANNGSGDHAQCMFVGGETNVTISNNTFSHCEIFDIFQQYGSSGAAGTFNGEIIAGNHFGPAFTDGSFTTPRDTALWYDEDNNNYTYTNITVSGNVFLPGATGYFPPHNSNFVVSGNTFGAAAICTAGVVYTGNTWPSGSC